MSEFNDFVNVLREKGVNVIVVKDTLNPDTPDSIFPNNWISFHEMEILLCTQCVLKTEETKGERIS